MAKRVMATLGQIETVALDRVRPYWRNPRRVTEDAVNMLVKSIQDFGYQQPIVVDSDYVIIVGHTRYAALRRLDVVDVPVMVAKTLTQEQVKQYRLIDNRAGELSSWDFTQLMDELGELDAERMAAFFPEIAALDEDAAWQTSDEGVLAREWDRVDNQVEFVCPTCFHSFEVEVTKAVLIAGIVRAGEATS